MEVNIRAAHTTAAACLLATAATSGVMYGDDLGCACDTEYWLLDPPAITAPVVSIDRDAEFFAAVSEIAGRSGGGVSRAATHNDPAPRPAPVPVPLGIALLLGGMVALWVLKRTFERFQQ